MSADRFDPKGTLDGAIFYAQKHSRQGGRRIVVDEFVDRDQVDHADLGRKDAPLSLDLFVWGDGYEAARNQLETVLDAPGPHKLVHPWLGNLDIHVESWTSTETEDELTVARFQVEYRRVDKGFPAGWYAATVEDVAVEHAASFTLVATAFEGGFSGVYTPIKGDSTAARSSLNIRPLAPAWVREDASAQTVAAYSAVAAALAKVRTIPEEAAAISARIKADVADVATLIRTPYNLGAKLVGIINDTSKALEQPGDAIALYRSLGEWSIYAPDFGSLTPDARLLQANRRALVSLVRRAAVAAGANALMSLAYSSRGEALAALDEWEQLLDEQGLTDLRAVFVDAMRAVGARLPDVVTLDLGVTTPALVVANKLYGATEVETRSAELVARNAVRHPALIPAGMIEALDE